MSVKVTGLLSQDQKEYIGKSEAEKEDPHFRSVGISEQNMVTYTNYLIGQLLTIVDASFTDIQQREAVKSLIKKDVWASHQMLAEWMLNQKDGMGSNFPFFSRN